MTHDSDMTAAPASVSPPSDGGGRAGPAAILTAAGSLWRAHPYS
eukprot:CAMPEP_0172198766 /NCGR_PEP_ID=MMETSP1050-20130122/28285_1 /TAXON_ID=233186 /ORGANISM="Cryptomonas curvata, Strain CCAP979/52" /LENGTH=43 /DNA_ID= /DNA_START= /DNA_END= /DNA_ORIENTATION=